MSLKPVCLSLMILGVSAILSPQTASAHPSDSLDLLDIPAYYGIPVLPSEADFAEFTFVQDFPPAESLTHAEQYILAGSMNAPGSDEFGLAEWWVEILNLVRSFEKQNGYIPEQLSEEIVISVIGEAAATEAPWRVEKFKSPLTNQFPRLDALYHSPGDVYIRQLTEDEIYHYCSYDPFNYSIYYDRLFYPNGMMMDPDLRANQQVEQVTSAGPVHFIRVHGWDGPIVDMISMTWSVAKDPSDYYE